MTMRSGHRMTRLFLALAACAVSGAALAAPPRIVSTLEGFAEGWTVGDMPLEHSATAPVGVEGEIYDDEFGDPAGSLRVTDLFQETAVFAPVDFLGDKHAYYGGTFSYGVVVRASDDTPYGEMVLRSEAMSLFYVPAAAPDVPFNQEFAYRHIPLTEAGWHVNSFEGPAATAEQMKAVLTALTGLYLRTEWKTGPDDTSLDNFEMENGVPQSAVSFVNAAITRNESVPSVKVELERTGKFKGAASVDYAVIGGNATVGKDYFPVAGTLRWPAGTGGIRSFRVKLKNDNADEANETIVIGLANVNNMDIGANSTVTVRIRDDDATTNIANFETLAKSVAEGTGGAGTTTTLRVTLTQVATRNVTVPFTVVFGTANAADFDSISTSPVVIKAGQKFADITIAIKADNQAEGNETVSFQLGQPTNALLGTKTLATLTITNDD